MKPLFDVSKIEVSTNSIIRKVAKQLGEQLRDEYISSIADFYADYSPKSYKRTYSLYEGMIGAGGKGTYQVQLKKNSYLAGIVVDSMFIPGDPYRKVPPHGLIPVKAEIFERSFVRGIHGYTRNEIIAYNKDKTKETMYHSGANQSPRRMSPSPERLMHKSWKMIGKTIPNLLDDAFSDAEVL